MDRYDKNCGLSEYEWKLEKIVEKIKAETRTLFAIKLLESELKSLYTAEKIMK
ncbi:MAG TPA: hypothetical protein VLH16_02790 [Bacteroidales bacterium]|nr:hypothetical protein [Bacteroidales bacterium]